MTGEEIEALAAIVRDLVETTSDPTQAADIAVADHVYALTEFCAKQNPFLDTELFRKACGL